MHPREQAQRLVRLTRRRRIERECERTSLRYFTLDGSEDPSHAAAAP